MVRGVKSVGGGGGGGGGVKSVGGGGGNRKDPAIVTISCTRQDATSNRWQTVKKCERSTSQTIFWPNILLSEIKLVSRRVDFASSQVIIA